MKNRRVVLVSRPHGEPTEENLRCETTELNEELKDRQILLKVLYLSLDPYMRGRMSAAKSYAKPVEIGDLMEGGTVAEVIASKHDGFKAGDKVLSYSGWQEYDISNGVGVRKLEASLANISMALGVLGMPGLTAYTGLLNIGKPQPGETVCVAAATGPVGSAVGQIAQIKGARAVGIAGGEQKCKALLDEFGFDAAVDHQSPDFAERLAEACPDGIDVYFENVGGHVFQTVLPLLNDFARIPVCGLIAHYNDTEAPPGPDRTPQLMMRILSRRLTFRGFIVTDFADQGVQFIDDMLGWMKEGRIKYREDIVEGLDAAPRAFIGLLKGKNFGKMLVRVAPE